MTPSIKKFVSIHGPPNVVNDSLIGAINSMIQNLATWGKVPYPQFVRPQGKLA